MCDFEFNKKKKRSKIFENEEEIVFLDETVIYKFTTGCIFSLTGAIENK